MESEPEKECDVAKDIDINTLKIVHTLVTCGTVTETAKRMNRSPGSISYQLSKAKDIIKAPLFIRTRYGMKPTLQALELSQRYQQIVELTSSEDQDSKGVFNINTFSLMEMQLTFGMLSSDKNNVHPYVFTPYTKNVDERIYKLKNHHTDIDIGGKLLAQEDITVVKLFTSPVVVLVSQHASSDNDTLSLECWNSARHAVWSGMTSFYCEDIQKSLQINDYLDNRDVAVVSDSLIHMISLCAHGDFIMLMPEYFVEMLEHYFSVTSLKLPFDSDIYYDCYLHYHNNLRNGQEVLLSISNALHDAKNSS